ncbi:DUF2779 domain-containing protein [Candidatus Chromulinivorax destructor]|uniref:DUF2779 domain-containing protein n=1 Tax=Candidatus Chromulinivorax destructor TaxID=2066483 RepID=A0A345ZAP9_9BACT|nr:DUF2779 domain-containing protein [Candidatus Chromulinivorax destructor]AXK60366.1 hypothetical protein C0J27_01195 [Candidatus Chromulinivorax destructor]
MITKTRYLDFLDCPKNAWLSLHKPELAHLFELSEFAQGLTEQGNVIESLARKRFPQGVLIQGIAEKALAATAYHLAAQTPVIFQAAFQVDQFFIRVDILEYDKKKQCWNLYEVKATNSVTENSKQNDHIEDVIFQKIIIESSGVDLGRVSVLHLNKFYVLRGQIDVDNLFHIQDVTDQAEERFIETAEMMQYAQKTLEQKDENSINCACIYKGRNSHCATFVYSHQDVPEYAIHDIARIGASKKKLAELVDKKIFDLKDVPLDFKLSEIQRLQLESHVSGHTFIDKPAIKNQLDQLIYPLYYLDYESFASAVPLFQGFSPYNQIPFQFSLHVQDSIDAQIVHYEYLHTKHVDPSLYIIAKLEQFIGSVGSIIVWSKSFEQGVHKNLWQRHPEHQEFLENLNARMYDLAEIFTKQLYVHPDFKGKTSIKKVLPALVPTASYATLGIQAGDVASQSWYTMMYGSLSHDEQLKIIQDLAEYCQQDTYAMYAILMKLYEEISS